MYAGLDKVAISSEVWVDPIDQRRLKFENWQTAVHEFSFTAGAAPTYQGSGIVDGSTIGQFAYGEIGDSLAVVTTRGTPWQQDPKVGVDLTILTPDGHGGLARTSKVPDLSNGKGGGHRGALHRWPGLGLGRILRSTRSTSSTSPSPPTTSGRARSPCPEQSATSIPLPDQPGAGRRVTRRHGR